MSHKGNDSIVDMLMDELIDQDWNDQVVETLGEFEFTRRELHAAFDLVCDEENWKMPIDKTVKLATDRERLAVHVAVRFFTGSVPTLHFAMTDTLESNMFRVVADGYYSAIGA